MGKQDDDYQDIEQAVADSKDRDEDIERQQQDREKRRKISEQEGMRPGEL